MAKFSIIIPVKAINDYVRENVEYIKKLDCLEWELIILPNEADLNEWPDDSRIRLVSTGRVGPAEKRDIGARLAKGLYLVFLDDDSYPQSDLLSIFASRFEDENVAAIGGPGITPESDSVKQQISGAVFLSKFTGGNPERYVPFGEIREVDDWPSVNLAVRRKAFLEVGGFDSQYWPGEDTEFCLKLASKGFRIYYDPAAVVWHHRREGILGHLKQVGNYGLHRGYFARHLPGNSRKFKYFLPSLVSIFWLSSLVAIASEQFRSLWAVGLVGYALTLILGLIQTVRYVPLNVGVRAIPYVVATHFWYGVRFMQGITKRTPLISRLR